MPHAIVSVQEIENEDYMALNDFGDRQEKKDPSSTISLEDLEEKETIGKGAVGEYHKCNWKGQQVNYF